LILESVKNGIQFHKFIMEAWIKTINDVKVPVYGIDLYNYLKEQILEI